MQQFSSPKFERWTLVAATLGLLAAGSASALEWNPQPPATKIADDMHNVHEYVMALIVVIFVGAFGVMFYSVFAHRKSKDYKAANFHENTVVEVIWTVIPLLILVVIAWPATRAVIAQKDPVNSDMTIKVTSFQWRWGYDYIKGEGEGISSASQLKAPRDQIEGKAEKGDHYLREVDNQLVVPVGKKVRILTTAADVIHAWGIPTFGTKQDAISGFIRDIHFKADQTGTYRGECVESCGKEHGLMPIVVRVVSAEDYTKWVDREKKTRATLAHDPTKTYTVDALKAHSEKVYASNCVAVREATGRGTPPAIPPRDASKIAPVPKAAHIEIVIKGKPNTSMVVFGKQLNDSEIATVVIYECNARRNKIGEAIQPAEIKALRK